MSSAEICQLILIASMMGLFLIALFAEAFLSHRLERIEARQWADPRIRPQMDYSQNVNHLPFFYRIRAHALRVAEPERSWALKRVRLLEAYIWTLLVLTFAGFGAMLIALLL